MTVKVVDLYCSRRDEGRKVNGSESVGTVHAYHVVVVSGTASHKIFHHMTSVFKSPNFVPAPNFLLG